MAYLEVGSVAPEFSLPDEKGKLHSLADYEGKKIVLYFYPKDDSYGCITEACQFRDDYDEYKKAGVEILGVSVDGQKSHMKFIAKYDLRFTLLTDPTFETLEAYGVWSKKSIYGKTFLGVRRTTYVIDEDRKIVKVFEKVKPKGHSQEILASFNQS
jgi:thioredoxin-dependent peroxiredoxin